MDVSHFWIKDRIEDLRRHKGYVDWCLQGHQTNPAVSRIEMATVARICIMIFAPTIEQMADTFLDHEWGYRIRERAKEWTQTGLEILKEHGFDVSLIIIRGHSAQEIAQQCSETVFIDKPTYTSWIDIMADESGATRIELLKVLDAISQEEEADYWSAQDLKAING